MRYCCLLLIVLLLVSLSACFFVERSVDVTFCVDDEQITVDMLTLQEEGIPMFEKVNYRLDGWYADKAFNKEVDPLMLTESGSVYARWVAVQTEKLPFLISFADSDGAVLWAQRVAKAEDIDPPKAPTKEGMRFVEWEGIPDVLTGDVRATARYVKVHTVTLMVDGAVYMELMVDEGATAEGWDVPTKADSDDTVYTFDKWNASLDNVTEDMVVEAVFSSAKRKYDCVFVVEGETISTLQINHGSAPRAPKTPSKDATNEYTYAFVGWDIDADGVADWRGSLPKLYQNIRAVAVFEASLRAYTVRYMVDGQVAYSQKVTYGGNAAYQGATPTKAATKQYTFTFSEWAGEQTNVTEDRDIVAHFAHQDVWYTYSFVWEDGTPYTVDGVAQSGTLRYGDPIPVPTIQPARAETNVATYTFEGWTGYTEGMLIEDNVQFVASIATNLRKYIVNYYYSSTQIEVRLYEYGTRLWAGGDEEPLPFPSDGNAYLWAGWHEGYVVTEDATFYLTIV